MSERKVLVKMGRSIGKSTNIMAKKQMNDMFLRSIVMDSIANDIDTDDIYLDACKLIEQQKRDKRK